MRLSKSFPGGGGIDQVDGVDRHRVGAAVEGRGRRKSVVRDRACGAGHGAPAWRQPVGGCAEPATSRCHPGYSSSAIGWRRRKRQPCHRRVPAVLPLHDVAPLFAADCNGLCCGRHCRLIFCERHRRAGYDVAAGFPEGCGMQGAGAEHHRWRGWKDQARSSAMRHTIWVTRRAMAWLRSGRGWILIPAKTLSRHAIYKPVRRLSATGISGDR